MLGLAVYIATVLPVSIQRIWQAGVKKLEVG
jgi:hypothetical protein